MNTNEIKINGEVYVKKDTSADEPYVIVRSRDSGCHAGFLISQEGTNVTLRNARRLWYWEGAATLSQLAMEGTSKPDACKFPCEVELILILGCCEIISSNEVARESIQKVKIWKA